MTEFLEGVELTKVYAEHNPSMDPSKIELPPGTLLLIRFPASGEETRAGIVIPAKDERGYEFPPNCSRVVGRGEGCKTPLGAYVFFAQKVPVDEEHFRKPQPLCYRYSDDPPILWTFNEKFLTAVVPHGGDPEWVALPDEVDQLSALGEWKPVPAKWVNVGTVFKLEPLGTAKRALTVKEDEDGNVTAYAFDIGKVGG